MPNRMWDMFVFSSCASTALMNSRRGAWVRDRLRLGQDEMKHKEITARMEMIAERNFRIFGPIIRNLKGANKRRFEGFEES